MSSDHGVSGGPRAATSVATHPAAAARLVELARAYALPDDAAGSLGALLTLHATDPHTPSAVRDPQRAVEAHVADSLAGLEVAELRTALRIADIGAGSGFPGLAIAVALPYATVALVESNERRCEFLTRAVAAARISNAEVVHARVESWRDGLGTCDAVTARALGALSVLLEYAAPLLRVGGALVAWKGVRDGREEEEAATAAGILGLDRPRVIAVEGGRERAHRHLYIYVKVSDTPPRFPRRPGIATKRPLGAGTRPAGERPGGAVLPPSDRQRR